MSSAGNFFCAGPNFLLGILQGLVGAGTRDYVSPSGILRYEVTTNIDLHSSLGLKL